MPIPETKDGEFGGGLLFDGCGYRDATDIVDFAHSGDRLGLVRKRQDHYRVELLGLHNSPQFSLPLWDAVREPVLCGSVTEAKTIIDAFIVGVAS